MRREREAQPEGGRSKESADAIDRDAIDRDAPAAPEEAHRLLTIFRLIASPTARARVIDLAVAEAGRPRRASNTRRRASSSP